jgi:type I restriction enzyme, S subunit
VLFTKSGASTLNNQRAILGNDSYVVSHIAVAVPSDGISSGWIYFSLVCVDFAELAHSSVMPSLPLSKIKPIQINLPPAREQVRIVEKLEELLSDLDAGVAELKAAQKKLGQYRQSLLKAAVEGALTADWRAARKVGAGDTAPETGAQLLERILTERRARWEAKQLAKFAEQGKAPPKAWQKKYPEPVQPETAELPKLPEGWVWASVDQVAEIFLGKMLDKTKHTSGTKMPYLRNVNVRWGSIETHDVSEMFFDNDELDRYGLVAGDVLVCEGGEPGRAAICRKEHESLKYQKALHRVRLFGLYEPELLVAFLEFVAKTGRLEKTFTGSTINHFTKESFLTLQIPLAPLCEQRAIVESLLLATSIIDEQKAALEVSFTQSAAQRKNILKAAFSGQLVPQDPNDEPANVLLERIRAERAERGKQPKVRKTKQQKEIAAMVSKLIDVLAEAGDWLPAQEAFRRCGVADGAQTEQLEALYAELRALDKAGRLAVEPVTDTQGRKLHDRLKLLAA